MAISLKESIIVGFQDFWSRKLRSLVTILGIVLGTMSIIVILSLVRGMNQMTLQWMQERGGLQKITVMRNYEYENSLNLPAYFTLNEFQFIRSLIPEVEYFNATLYDQSMIKKGEKSFSARLIGTFPDYEIVEEWTADQGRFFKSFDIQENNNVIVIGSTIKDELFGNKNPIGQLLDLDGTKLTVIGVMKHRYMQSQGKMFGDNPLEWMNRTAIVPISTMIHKMSVKDQIDEITVKAPTMDASTVLTDKLNNILLNLRRGHPVFRVESAKEEAEKMKENSFIFQIIFFFISSISLIVGGIVIMNIMLASIQERTREIGIRLAMGARRIDIFIQFLVQTVLITFLGGLLGVLLGLSIVRFVGNFLTVKTAVDFSMIIIALVVSVGVGFFFGIFPAIKASNLNPVEALRYE